MTHGGANVAFDGSGLEPGRDPVYWVMPIGLFLGVLLVVLFEYCTRACLPSQRKALFKSLSIVEDQLKIDPKVEVKLERKVDGIYNVIEFWSGGLLRLLKSKEHKSQTYEMLALLSALLFSVSVAFYTASAGDHLYGLIGCVANCAFWMATLSSTFLVVVINSCERQAQLNLLIGLYGSNLMRIPMILFVWGSILLFLEFVVYFKLNVDPGFNCSMCLGSCLVLLPLFLHCMHKMGWAATIVHEQAEIESRTAVVPTPANVRANFRSYVFLKGDNCLALDRDEFLDSMQTPGIQVTSVQQAFAAQIFDAHVDAELRKLGDCADCYAVAATPEDIWKSFCTYVASKGDNCLALDRDEFLNLLKKPGVRVTSVQRAFAAQMFDAHVDAELLKLGASIGCFKDRELAANMNPPLKSPSQEPLKHEPSKYDFECQTEGELHAQPGAAAALQQLTDDLQALKDIARPPALDQSASNGVNSVGHQMALQTVMEARRLRNQS